MANHLGLPHPGLLLIPPAARNCHPHHGKLSPRVKEWCYKESHRTSLKHKDKSCGDKSSKPNLDNEANKSLHKCHILRERALLGILLRPQALTHTAKCMSETEDQSSFTTPSSTSTPNKIGNGLRFCSSSTDSRCSMTPLDTLLYGRFRYSGPTGMGHSSVTPVTSVAGLQQVTSSMWQLPGPFFSTLLPATDTLSAGKVEEIYQLATECQTLGAELAKQFQNLSGLEVMYHTTDQVMLHEKVNMGYMAHNAAFSTITANQPEGDHEKFLPQFCTEADQAQKDMNDVIFSHQIKYDAQLAAFITTAEGTLQVKWDEILSHIHSITEVAGLPNKACLTLAL